MPVAEYVSAPSRIEVGQEIWFLNPGDTRLATASDGKTAAIWNTTTEKLLHTLQYQHLAINVVSVLTVLASPPSAQI